ncbi:hypothetical protein BC629DRAFT_412621 [Irpex lacteus]|nr:hypothetical protein BC629DRAFT_412621 [Irpex lacteus]
MHGLPTDFAVDLPLHPTGFVSCSASAPLYDSEVEDMTILLESILHFTVFSHRTISIRWTSALGYEGPNALLYRLGRTISIALQNEDFARRLFNILSELDGEAEYVTPNSICIQLARAQIENSEILQSWPPEGRTTARVSPQGIANIKATIIREYDSVLQLLRSCQAAMVVFRIVFFHKDNRSEVRRIFTSLVSLLRSHTVAAQHNERDQRSIAEVANICLLTMTMYQGWYDFEDEKRFEEPLSIFPDTLVEALMDLDVAESQDSLRSFFRIRRIEEKRARLAIEQAESPTSPPDIVAAPMASEAAREDDLSDPWSIKWHLDLGM